MRMQKHIVTSQVCSASAEPGVSAEEDGVVFAFDVGVFAADDGVAGLVAPPGGGVAEPLDGFCKVLIKARAWSNCCWRLRTDGSCKREKPKGSYSSIHITSGPYCYWSGSNNKKTWLHGQWFTVKMGYHHRHTGLHVPSTSTSDKIKWWFDMIWYTSWSGMMKHKDEFSNSKSELLCMHVYPILRRRSTPTIGASSLRCRLWLRSSLWAALRLQFGQIGQEGQVEADNGISDIRPDIKILFGTISIFSWKNHLAMGPSRQQGLLL